MTKTKEFLIVDDSSIVRKVAINIVQELGFVSREAEDGEIALEKCQEKIPDYILLDWNMPNMDGLSFLRTLRSKINDGTKPIVIFCTTENSMNHINSALNEGANEYIMKPFDKEILENKLIQMGEL